jgi:hypothetical protein
MPNASGSDFLVYKYSEGIIDIEKNYTWLTTGIFHFKVV